MTMEKPDKVGSLIRPLIDETLINTLFITTPHHKFTQTQSTDN